MKKLCTCHLFVNFIRTQVLFKQVRQTREKISILKRQIRFNNVPFMAHCVVLDESSLNLTELLTYTVICTHFLVNKILTLCSENQSSQCDFGECLHESLTACIFTLTNEIKRKESFQMTIKISSLHFLRAFNLRPSFEPTCFESLLSLYSVTPWCLCF